MLLDDVLGGATIDLRQGHAEIERLAAEGKVPDLVRIARVVRHEAGIGRRGWMLDAIVRALALTPSSDAATAVFQLVPSRVPMLARMLGQAQSLETCAALVERHHDELIASELLAVWVQELVARGVDCREHASIEHLWAWLRRTSHPLGGLPLWRLPIERDLGDLLWEHTTRGSQPPFPFDPEALPGALIAAPGVIAAREIAAPRELAALFASWRGAEVRAFELAEPIAPDRGLSIAQVRALGLAYRDGAATAALRAIAAAGALSLLFWVASCGGAGLGADAGCARLAAWRALASTIDHAVGADLETIAAAAARASFYALRGDLDSAPLDVGVVCLRSDRRTIVVAAASA